MFPAQALAEHLSGQGWQIAMMTDARGRKHAGRIPADPIFEVKAASISPRRPVKVLSGIVKLYQGTQMARQFLREWKADIVVGFGGYPAFPAMAAAQGLSIPTIIHEQNAVLGRVNRLFARKAFAVATGFPTLSRLPQGVDFTYVGNPLRAQITGAVPKAYTWPRRGTINLLIVGGSLGARILSQTLPTAIAGLSQDIRARLNVVQQTTEGELEAARQTYAQAGVKARCEVFFDDIETHLSRAHYVIARAGASSLSEISLMGKPSLLIPLAIAMDDHQMVNALSLKNKKAADILPESEFTSERVTRLLEKRFHDPDWLNIAADNARKIARPDALTQLATVVKAAIS